MLACCLPTQNQGHPGHLRGEFAIETESSWQIRRWMAFSPCPPTPNTEFHSLFSLQLPRVQSLFFSLSQVALAPSTFCFFVFYTVRELRRPRVQVHRVLWECKPQSITLGCSPHLCLRRQLAQCHSADTVLFIAWDSEWQVVKPKGCRA